MFDCFLKLISKLQLRGIHTIQGKEKYLRSAFPTVCSEEPWFLRMSVNVTWETGFYGEIILGKHWFQG